ncbi:hypothetical protein BH10CYA1_BH10CYA1_32530 [soil metagenome]
MFDMKNQTTFKVVIRLQVLFARVRSLAKPGVEVFSSANEVVAGEAFLFLEMAKQAGEITRTICQKLGISHVRILAQDLPTDGAELKALAEAMTAAADEIARKDLEQFGINKEAAFARIPDFVNELADVAENLLDRAERHLLLAQRANVASVPQSDGDDGASFEFRG